MPELTGSTAGSPAPAPRPAPARSPSGPFARAIAPRADRAPPRPVPGGARIALSLALGLALGLGAAPPARADTAEARVALSVGHAGDPWRRASLEAWGEVAERAARDGVVAAADAYAADTHDPAEQVARVESLIEDGYDAIVLDASPSAALDAAVGRACDAGIVVVSFGGLVGAPCAWRVSIDHRRLGRSQVNRLAERLPHGGNLLQVRGPAGELVDERVDEGIRASVEAWKRFEVLASVRAGLTREQTREAVAAALPGLPPVVGVVTHGVDGLGVAEAFEAAGRDVPPITLGNRHAELAWWAERAEASGYETWSAAMAPGVSTLAFWIARRLLDGVPVARDVTVEYLAVEAEGLDAALLDTDVDGVLDRLYSEADADRVIAGAD